MLKLGTQLCLKKLCSNVIKPLPKNPFQGKGYVEQTQIARSMSFFNKNSGELLWKSLMSVSNAGKKRGRGKDEKRKRRNLNVGQRMGEGKVRVVWPGLSTPVLQGNTLVSIKKLPDAQKEEVSTELKLGRKRKTLDKHPLNRGWCGKSVEGKMLDPPSLSDLFQDFKSVVLEHKLVATVTKYGKKRRFASLVVTGNENGVIGIGYAKSVEGRSAILLAKSKAAKRLITIDLIDKHTVNHDFFCQFGKTKIFVYKRPEGHGLCCQRLIKVLCQLLGIKDLRAKIEGPVTYKHVARAFLLGLLRQKTYQEIADDSRRHLVEYTKECHNYPKLLASPRRNFLDNEVSQKPVVFEEYIMGNKLVLDMPKKLPWYTKLPSWEKHLKRTVYERNHKKVKIELLAEYGSYRSFLSDRYPECTETRNAKKVQ